MPEYSFSPTGEKFLLPEQDDYSKEFERLKELVNRQRALGTGDCFGYGGWVCWRSDGCSGC